MAGWVSGPSCSTETGHALLGALNLLPSARGYRAQLWGLPVPQGELGRVGMVLRGDLEGVLHLPDCHHHGSLWCRVWSEAGESALHQAHSGERAGGQGQLLAGGRPHPEGMGGPGLHGTSLWVSSAPLWRAHPWLVSLQGPAMAMLEAVLSGAHFLPQPRWLSQRPRRGS